MARQLILGSDEKPTTNNQATATTATTAATTPASDNILQIIDTSIDNSQKKLAIGIAGISGSGKTTTALMWAEITLLEQYPELKSKVELNDRGNIFKVPAEIGKKIGIIDTEHKRSLHSINHLFHMKEYGSYQTGGAKIINVDTSTATAEMLNNAKQLLISAGCEVVIVDSLSHAWDAILEDNDKLQTASNTKSGYTWGNKIITGSLRKIKEGVIVDDNTHIISCMRASKETILDAQQNGKVKIVNSSVKPKMKEDVTYEFQILLLMQADHTTTIVKDNTGLLLDGMLLTPNLISLVTKWLNNTLDITVSNSFIWTQLNKLDKIAGERDKVIGLKQRYLKDMKIDIKTPFSKLGVQTQLGLIEAVKDEFLNDIPYVSMGGVE